MLYPFQIASDQGLAHMADSKSKKPEHHSSNGTLGLLLSTESVLIGIQLSLNKAIEILLKKRSVTDTDSAHDEAYLGSGIWAMFALPALSLAHVL